MHTEEDDAFVIMYTLCALRIGFVRKYERSVSNIARLFSQIALEFLTRYIKTSTKY